MRHWRSVGIALSRGHQAEDKWAIWACWVAQAPCLSFARSFISIQAENDWITRVCGGRRTSWLEPFCLQSSRKSIAFCGGQGTGELSHISSHLVPSFPGLRNTAGMHLSWNHNESWFISYWETYVTQHEWAASWFQSRCCSACGYWPVLSGIKDSYCLCCTCAWGPREGMEISQAVILVLKTQVIISQRLQTI